MSIGIGSALMDVSTAWLTSSTGRLTLKRENGHGRFNSSEVSSMVDELNGVIAKFYEGLHGIEICDAINANFLYVV